MKVIFVVIFHSSLLVYQLDVIARVDVLTMKQVGRLECCDSFPTIKFSLKITTYRLTQSLRNISNCPAVVMHIVSPDSCLVSTISKHYQLYF